MPKLKDTLIAIASINQTPFDKNNIKRIKQIILEAKQKSVELLVFPELALNAYGCEDIFFQPKTHLNTLKYLQEIIDYSENIFLTIGLAIEHNHLIYNAYAIIENKKLLAIYCKKKLAKKSIYYEPRWFQEWEKNSQDTYQNKQLKCPIGDITVKYKNYTIGFEICEDAWTKERNTTIWKKNPPDIIINGSASHYCIGKQEIRKEIIKKGSTLYNNYYIYSNLIGNESGQIIFDGACLIAHKGNIIFESPRFSLKKQHLYIQKLGQVSGELKPLNKFEELNHAISLGLFDYLTKSHSKGFVLSLSGGIDSAMCALLINELSKKIFNEFSLKEIKQIFNFINSPINSPIELNKNLLISIYQATVNNSPTTQKYAKNLADALNIEFISWQLDSIIEQYEQLVNKGLNYQTNWENDELSKQNIQARARVPALWMIANIRQAILLTTSNLSEIAVGYTTMDGDSCGGLAPIATLEKSLLQEYMKYLATQSSCPKLAKAINNILSLKPSAELKPLKENQYDEKELPPYIILDNIHQLFIAEKYSFEEIQIVLQEKNPNISPKQISLYIKQFTKLFGQSQWKRERMAPSFHLQDKAISPRNSFKFPILSKPL